MDDKPRCCPDCGSLLKPYIQKQWDNCRETGHPALYCEACKRTYYAEILDLARRRPHGALTQHVHVS